MAYSETRTYSSSPSDVVLAVRSAVTQLGWKVQSEDPSTWVMFLSTKVSLRSWGEHAKVTIRAVEGGTAVDVAVSLRFQLVGLGAQKRSALRLAEAISGVLSAP
jgi:hypothetical protein